MERDMARKTNGPIINMEFAEIAGTQLKVPRIAIGTWAIGGWMWGGTDETESIATIHAAIERGITLVDTAPVYGFGRSEEIVGKALAEAGLRSRAIIATKVGLEWRDGKVFRNSSRARIMRECENSLRRLRTDYLDIYQVHWPDPLVTIDETAEAMHTLYKQGKIRAIGVSNYSVPQIERFRSVAPLHVLQPPYNVFERAIKSDVLPYCRKNNISTFGYGSLCRGLLSGRMRPRAGKSTSGRMRAGKHPRTVPQGVARRDGVRLLQATRRVAFSTSNLVPLAVLIISTARTHMPRLPGRAPRPRTECHPANFPELSPCSDKRRLLPQREAWHAQKRNPRAHTEVR